MNCFAFWTHAFLRSWLSLRLGLRIVASRCCLVSLSLPSRLFLPAGFSLPACLFMLAWLSLSTGCGKEPASPGVTNDSSKTPRNLVVITLDTLRADHVGCYGALDVKTPALDRIAAQGALFLNTTSVAPLTLPAHASLFTGTYPFTHGVRDNMGFLLPEEANTLAEILKVAGWNTAGFVSAYVLDNRFGIAQGFSHYSLELEFEDEEIISGATVQRDGRETLDDLLVWLDKNHEEPFFVWAHFFDPHLPYTPPEPYATLYALSPYSGEVAYTDALVGELIEKLDGLGHESDTVVAIVGDHGESLGEHNEKYHGLFVYDATLQVPFILRAPGVEPCTIEDQVRIIDIMPTALDLLQIESPFRQGQGLIRGQSLVPLLEGDGKSLNLLAYSESHYPRLHYGWSNLISLRSEKYKYIQAPKPELYELSSDPRELKNLIDSHPQIARRMKQSLEELGRSVGRAALDESTPTAGDAETTEALKALGYTGSVAPGGANIGGILADPKDKISLLNRLEQAERLIASGDPSSAIPLIREVVKEEPRMLDARISLGVAIFQINDFTAAANVFEEVLELDSENFIALMNLGMCRQRLGQEGAAQTLFTRAIENDPSNQKAVDTLIDSLIRTGNMKKAIEVCKAFLELKPESTHMRVRLATCHFNRGYTRDAKKTIERGLELDPAGENLNYLMGKIWEDRTKYDEAIEAYEAELEHNKGNADVYLSLALLFEKSKAWEKVIALLEEGIARHGEQFECHLILARAYQNTEGNRDKAAVTAKKALDLNPSSQEARALYEAVRGK